MNLNLSLNFVILEHDYPTLHWDFMLESAGVLKTWRLLEEPAPGRTVRAEPIADHRIEYLNYEGPVSGNRGHVSQWDKGTYETTEPDSSELMVRLEGSRLSSVAVIGTDSVSFSD